MLLCLSTELLEQVFLAQGDLKDIISLGFTCSRLHSILEQPRMWRIILARARNVGKVSKINNLRIAMDFTKVEMLMKFLKTTDEPYKFLNTILLHDTICQLYPGEEVEEALHTEVNINK